MSRHQIQTCILIDDSDDDVFLTTRFFERSKIDLKIHRYNSGEAFLSDAANIHKEMAELSILITDLRLGMATGIDVIQALGEMDNFGNTIMGICSDSEDPNERVKARSAGAAFFISKPLDLKALQEISRCVSSLEIEQPVDNGTVALFAR